MKHYRQIAFWTLFIFVVSSCGTVPITGRRQLALVPEETVLSASYQQYQQFLKENTIITGTPESRMVKEVGQRIQTAVEQYMTEQGMAEELENFEWEFNLVESDQVNAWAMPGGKVAVYQGILPVTRDEAGLAAVVGHEIAHVVARHGQERVSQGLLTQMGGLALSVALSQRPQETQQLWMAAFGAGAQVGILLPFSRLHESEADHLGLIFMAMAGYDPHAAVGLWERMAQQREGPAPPEFLSTHPADQTRIENIKEIIPEAMKYYRPAAQ
jgi:predicted Zn-dependent protease